MSPSTNMNCHLIKPVRIFFSDFKRDGFDNEGFELEPDYDISDDGNDAEDGDTKGIFEAHNDRPIGPPTSPAPTVTVCKSEDVQLHASPITQYLATDSSNPPNESANPLVNCLVNEYIPQPQYQHSPHHVPFAITAVVNETTSANGKRDKNVPKGESEFDEIQLQEFPKRTAEQMNNVHNAQGAEKRAELIPQGIQAIQPGGDKVSNMVEEERHLAHFNDDYPSSSPGLNAMLRRRKLSVRRGSRCRPTGHSRKGKFLPGVENSEFIRRQRFVPKE